MEVDKKRVEQLESDIKKILLKIENLKEEFDRKKLELRHITTPRPGHKSVRNPNHLDPILNEYLHVPIYNIGNYRLEVNPRILYLDGVKLFSLTQKEVNLLVVLAANVNNFVERKVILKTIWHEVSYQNSRSMDVYVCKARKLLSNDPKINIVNQHGYGFMLAISE
jgi:DNA-binding response OmpR family regulator